jgi:hypothetical protein
MTGTPCRHIFPIKCVLYDEVIKDDNQLEKYDSFVQHDVRLTVLVLGF